VSIGGDQQAGAPGPVTGPGAPASPGPPPSPERGTLAGLAVAAVRMLRLVGSRCCVARADAAWRRTVNRE
jgi:hypothetical protein